MTSHPTRAMTACLALQHAIRSVTGRIRWAPGALRFPAKLAWRPTSAACSAAVTRVAGGVLSCIRGPSGKLGGSPPQRGGAGQNSLEGTRTAPFKVAQTRKNDETAVTPLPATRGSAVASDGDTGELILIRHGETIWSRELKHTGRTDIPLTPAGEAAAARLAADLAARHPVAAFASPSQRAVRTAELAGLTEVPAGLKIDPDLAEWDYGGYEGRTTPEIQRDRPGWYLWREGVIPGDADHPGESIAQVAARADAVLARVSPLLARGNVALVAHGHLLRILTARWLDLDPRHGRLFRLDTGTLSILGAEHGEPVIAAWNLPPTAPGQGLAAEHCTLPCLPRQAEGEAEDTDVTQREVGEPAGDSEV